MIENLNEMKPIIKMFLIVNLIVCYFVNLICMFDAKPIDILIANIIVWLIIILIPLGIAFVLWLIDWE